MYFLLWYDDNKKKALDDKVREGFQVYVNKYGFEPTIIGVSPGIEGTFNGIDYQEFPSIRENCFWFGPLMGGPR